MHFKISWIHARCKNLNIEFVIFSKNTKTVLRTTIGLDQSKIIATAIRKKRGLKLDDVSFMTSKRFFIRTFTAR